jgi:hypothetical protein
MRGPLQVGDVIVKQWGQERVYIVVKTPGNSRKLWLLRLHTGTLLDTWWKDRQHLPRRYRYVGTVPAWFIEELRSEDVG